eukprot:TRINITY_DN21975_c0_g1_i1.p1 TRINITY_DN21975_c0_g1~~TRINITY_DN21975_c0_g1_i1.p1  ORF type:complete len:489 (+),score=75.85 TRINITY_DN21975_c0_g1_i1:94-1560(+)
MTTAAEILAQIETARRELQESDADCELALMELNDAIQRQRLRRVLESLREANSVSVEVAKKRRRTGCRIDADEVGPHMLGLDDVHDHDDGPPQTHQQVGGGPIIGSEHVMCDTAVVKGEYIWRIGGMSWLVEALKQSGRSSVCGRDYFMVGENKFDFHYRPCGGLEGTLAIEHCEAGGVTFRYRIYIKRCSGDFEQWGDTGNICDPKKAEERFYGPDVPGDGGSTPQGVFGLSHMVLLNSEWVQDDTMTVKIELELRQDGELDIVDHPRIQVPPASISAELSSLFGNGKGSDVTFRVHGELIKAHSPILCARSEVFDKLLHGGMQESLTKEIQVDDCDVRTFKELIRFVYTDEFSHIESFIDEDMSCCKGVAILQGLLAASHKYALSRLQLWCEASLCGRIAVNNVFAILCQAHLHDAKQLADACLSFIQHRYETLVVTEEFGKLAREWPEVIIKINLFMGRIQEDRAVPAIQAARGGLTGKHKSNEA